MGSGIKLQSSNPEPRDRGENFPAHKWQSVLAPMRLRPQKPRQPREVRSDPSRLILRELTMAAPCFEQIDCTNANDYEYGSGDPMQITLRYPTVTCPGCKRPMTPSPPLAVSDDTDLCDLTYTCKECGATTTRTIKIEKQ